MFIINNKSSKVDLHKKIMKAYLNSFARKHNLPEQLEELILSFAYYSPFVSQNFYTAIYIPKLIKLQNSPSIRSLKLDQTLVLQEKTQYKINNQIIYVQKIWSLKNKQKTYQDLITLLFSNFIENVYQCSWLDNHQLVHIWKCYYSWKNGIPMQNFQKILQKLKNTNIIKFSIGQKYKKKQCFFLIQIGYNFQNVGKIIYRQQNGGQWLLQSYDNQVIWKKSTKFNRKTHLIYDQLQISNIWLCQGSKRYLVQSFID